MIILIITPQLNIIHFLSLAPFLHYLPPPKLAHPKEMKQNQFQCFHRNAPYIHTFYLYVLTQHNLSRFQLQLFSSFFLLVATYVYF